MDKVVFWVVTLCSDCDMIPTFQRAMLPQLLPSGTLVYYHITIQPRRL